MKALRIDTTKKFKHYGEKIKQVCFHPTQPLLLAAQFNGKITIFNYELQSISKQIDVSDKPLRTAIWISDDRILTAGDDLFIRIYSFHTTQKLIQFQGHNDFIRRVLFNPQTKEILSCSDEKNIILWEFDEKKNTYNQKKEWKEHSHFVMDMKFNPKEDNSFTTCSLDKTIKIWNSKSDSSNGTLRGHESGVNCIDFYNQDKYLLISGSDDFQVIVWDFVSRVQLRNIKRHNGNVMDVVFTDKIPFFASLAEDGYLNFYGLKNYEFSFDVVNFMNKGWSLTSKNNLIAAAYDEGCVVIQLGNDKPISSASKGKLTWSNNGEVFSVNLKAIVANNAQDNEILDANVKDLGVLQIFPNQVSHNDNGQFLAFFDGQEYYIYKSLAFKLQLYGDAKEFCWGSDKTFAIVNDMNELIIQSTTGDIIKTLNFDFYIEKIYGGKFLGIAGSEFVLFYDWTGDNMIGKIDVEMSEIYWEENNFLLKSSKQTFMLQYQEGKSEEETFDLKFDSNEQIFHGKWQNGFFFFVDIHNKFKVFIKDKTFTLANFKENKVISDYLKNHERFFFFDNSSNISTIKFSKQLLNIFEKHLKDLDNCDFDQLIKDCEKLDEQENDLIGKILITFEFQKYAYRIVKNIRTKFDLAVELNYLKEAIDFCKELQEPIYWKKLGDFAMLTGKFNIAEEAYLACEDNNSLLMLACCLGKKDLIIKVGKMAQEQKHYSVAFVAYLNCQQLEKCLEILVISQNFSQALFFAKNYLPSKISSTFEQWKNHLHSQKNYLAQRIANPIEYKEEYPDFELLQKIEEIVLKNFDNFTLKSTQYLSYEDTIKDFDFYTFAKEEGLEQLDQKLNELLSMIN